MQQSDREETSPANETMTENEALAGLLSAAMHTDDVSTEDEKRCLHGLLSRMRLFEGWTDEQYRQMFEKLEHLLRNQGLTTLMELSSKALPLKFRPTAFALSVDVVLADGMVMDEEKDFLYTLQQVLEIEDPLAQKILEVIIIKNRG
ncbi:MAG: tellurite resistance TerB family protein [bacterium]|nr:tellurite resistance TerB family protein [bacterium]